MCNRVTFWLAVIVPCLSLGCGTSERVELEKVKAELVATRAELEAARATQKPSYLEELERLDALRSKGVLTQDEFDAKKKVALATPDKPRLPSSSVDELANQLRTVQALYGNSTITNLERDAKKQQLIQKSLVVVDFKKDLETIQKLYNESVITNLERDELKQKVLNLDSKK